MVERIGLGCADACARQINVQPGRRSAPATSGAGSRTPGTAAQIFVLHRAGPSRPTFRATDKLVLGWLCQLFPNIRNALTIVRPETVVRWHRAGFRSYWRWKSRRRAGRPTLPVDIRQLIREMSIVNPLWGAPRISWRTPKTRDRCRANQRSQIHAAKARATVARMEDLSSQSCRWHHRYGLVRGAKGFVPALVRSANHGSWPATDPVAWRNGASDCGMDRQSTHPSLRLGVLVPTYLLRDRDACYGHVFTRRLRSLVFAIDRHPLAHPGRTAMRNV